MENNQLIVFVKNAELGKVKTRLAKSIGANKALLIYKVLLMHTYKITSSVEAQRKVYYSEFIPFNDEFESNKFEKRLQCKGNLGKKMYEALNDSFKERAKKAVLIGSDNYEIGTSIIEKAFTELDKYDVVLGPATDGGYYLIGMKSPDKTLFENITWSKENVLLDTILHIKKAGKTYKLLPTLNDVDTEEDLGVLKNFI